MSDESPASTAGLQVGDLIVEFGTLKSDNFTNLTMLATVAESSKNENMRVKVIRNGELKTLLLKPRAWSGRRNTLFCLKCCLDHKSLCFVKLFFTFSSIGRGLLGCHVRPVEAKPDR